MKQNERHRLNGGETASKEWQLVDFARCFAPAIFDTLDPDETRPASRVFSDLRPEEINRALDALKG